MGNNSANQQALTLIQITRTDAFHGKVASGRSETVQPVNSICQLVTESDFAETFKPISLNCAVPSCQQLQRKSESQPPANCEANKDVGHAGKIELPGIVCIGSRRRNNQSETALRFIRYRL